MKSKKELKGFIYDWYIVDYESIDLDKYANIAGLVKNPEGCYIIKGYVKDHPKFGSDTFHTSQVITPKKDIVEGAVIETINSLYKLGERFDRDTCEKAN